MTNKEFGTVIGSFGKGISGSVTVNFGISGGQNCDDSCTLKGTVCYAEQTEKMKPSITKNLLKKENNFSGYLDVLTSDKAITKLNLAEWIRFSAFGSIPKPDRINLGDRLKLSQLANSITDHSKVHFPVETEAKARLLQGIGFNARLSLGTDIDRIKQYKGDLPCSATVRGDKLARGKNKRDHSSRAFDKAKELNEQGIKTKVCPAIAGSAKCGDCKLCARRDIDLIIYPMH